MLTHSLGRVAKYALQDPWETFSGVSLCLKGGYAVNELLLSDASMSEVLARVAFQLIVQDYHCYPDEYDSPAAGMFGLYRALQKSGYKALATWVLAYAVSWAPLVTTSALREMFVQGLGTRGAALLTLLTRQIAEMTPVLLTGGSSRRNAER